MFRKEAVCVQLLGLFCGFMVLFMCPSDLYGQETKGLAYGMTPLAGMSE
jgi:hypothetical protein